MIGSLDKLTKQFEAIVPVYIMLSVLLVLITGFSLVALRYFADRQRAVVFSARKVIVLRRMLGLSYGTMQLVLPNWRIEGADEPFAVRLFPGWRTYVTYPYYALAGISSAVTFFLLSALCKVSLRTMVFGNIPVWIITLFLSCLWALFLACAYRHALLDVHERPLLLSTQNFARFLRLKLVTNFEYVIYRATLARYEIARLKVDLTNLKKALVFIEDRSFFTHCGLSVRALIRALLGLLGLKRRSGPNIFGKQYIKEQSICLLIIVVYYSLETHITDENSRGGASKTTIKKPSGKSGDTILVSENNWYGISRFYERENGMEKNNSEIIIYQTEDGATKINVRLDGNSVWVTQTDLVELFQSSKSNISEHIKHIFEEGELIETAVVRKFRTTAPDGKNYNVAFYNLDVIISIGYRVKSLRGVQFRIWATERLREYLIKGFTMNDDLLKRNSGGEYFEELLARIRDIRSSEKVFYWKYSIASYPHISTLPRLTHYNTKQ